MEAAEPGRSRGETEGWKGRPEPLSPAEIRGLLGDDAAAAATDPEVPGSGRAECPSPRLRVLLVTRDEDEVQLLRGVLGGLGMECSAVRNPFSALDQIRLRGFDGIVSDFDLWSSSGELLFQRLGASAAAPVVFVCAGSEAARAARAAGASDVLRRPLQPGDIARVGDLFGVGRVSDSSAADRPTEPKTSVQRQLEREPEPEPRSSTAPARSTQPRALEELAWLRFFFEARRLLRREPPGRERIGVLLAAFAREVGWESCGVGLAREDGWFVSVRPGAREILSRLGAALSVGPPQPRAAPPASPDADRPTWVGVEDGCVSAWWTQSGRSGVFMALPPTDGGAPPALPAPVPPKFVDELAALMAEAGIG